MTAPVDSLTQPLALRRDATQLGVYIHFPYCIRKCHYCDFFSVGLDSLAPDRQVPADLLGRYERALFAELSARQAMFARHSRVNTIFLGGGTASLLPPESLARILNRLRESFQVADDAEITLEGNPENFTAEYMARVRELGVNRINVGVQTLQTDFLDSMNRYYDAGRYDEIFARLERAPFANAGGDLIYGFAGQSFAQFETDLERALAARLSHLSVYSLTVESGTPYAALLQRGAMRAPEEKLQETIFRVLPERLAQVGLRQYEISNYARPGFECRHNLRYWLYEPYLGLGPGAHGFDGRQRYGNPRSVAAWEADPPGAPLQCAAPLSEVPLMFLRLTAGIALADVADCLAEAGLSRAAARAPEIFEAWSAAGSGRILERDGARWFVWAPEATLQLDDRVAEFSAALEAAGD